LYKPRGIVDLEQAIEPYGEGGKEAEAAQRKLDDATQKYTNSTSQLKMASALPCPFIV